MINDKRLYTIIGNSIRQARVKTHITQTVLAKKLGLTRASISNFESGNQRIQLNTLYHIAIILDVPITELLPQIALVTMKTATAPIFAKNDESLITTLLNGESKEGEI